MRIVIQRVKRASVDIEGQGEREKREIGQGMCVLVGVTHGDTEAGADWLHIKTGKLAGFHIFADSEGREQHEIGQGMCVLAGTEASADWPAIAAIGG